MIGIISDVHGRLDALTAALGDMPESVDRIVCCGDVVGYGPRPRGCVELVRAVADDVVQGNHDRYVAEPRGGRLLESLPRHSTRALADDQVEWLAALPKTCEVGGYLVTHSHPAEDGRSIHRRDVGDVRRHLDGYDGLVFGHTHRQFSVRRGGHHFLNPGCVGKPRPSNFKPPTCVGLRPEYALLDRDDGSVRLRQVDYGIRDVSAAVLDGIGRLRAE